MYELSTKIPKADLIQMVWFFRFFVDFKFVCLFKRKKLLLCLKKIESFFHHFQSNIVVSIKFFSNVLLFFSCEFFMLIILRILQNFFKNFTKFEVVIHADKPLFLNLKLIIKNFKINIKTEHWWALGSIWRMLSTMDSYWRSVWCH